MMDTLTHAISGAVIGAATARHDAGDLHRRAFWGALFAAFPDSDVVLLFFTDEFTYLNAHRGWTHSVLLLPVWAALLGWLGSSLSPARWRMRWRDMAVLAAAALAAHILGDLITSYGTRVFAPLYDAPLAFPITFIIDPLFTAILLAGLGAALWRRRPMFATASGAVLVAYLVLQVFMQQRALAIGADYAATLNEADAPVIVFPQPLSPFNWKIVVVGETSYHRAYVNLLAGEAPPRASNDAGLVTRLRAAYQPADAAHWRTYRRWPDEPAYRDIAVAAWQQPVFAGFRRFALLPYVTSMRGVGAGVCVWFTDMRFTLPGLAPSFEYAMCRGGGGVWRLEYDREK